MDNSLRKILDVLQLNRLSIETDRKSYDKVKNEIKTTGDKFTKLTEGWTSIQKKIKGLGEMIAARSSDIGLHKIKIQVMAERCDNLEANIQQKRNHRENFHQQLADEGNKRLDRLGLFLIEWNCSSSGETYRKMLFENVCSLYETRLDSKKKELDNIVTPMRNLEQGERDKEDLEKQYRNSVQDLRKEEQRVRSEIKRAEKKLSALKRKRKEAKTPGTEASRMAEQIGKTRDAISFWKNRVSELENA